MALPPNIQASGFVKQLDDNNNTLGVLANPDVAIDQIRALIQNAQAFSATTGIISSATNANLFGGMELFANNLAKSIYLFYIGIMNVNVSGDIRINSLGVQDANLTQAITSQNMQPASGVASLAAVTGSPAGFTTGGAQSGSGQLWSGASATNVLIQAIQNNMGYYIKNGTVGGIAVYNKLPTAGNSFSVTMQWLEF